MHATNWMDGYNGDFINIQTSGLGDDGQTGLVLSCPDIGAVVQCSQLTSDPVLSLNLRIEAGAVY